MKITHAHGRNFSKCALLFNEVPRSRGKICLPNPVVNDANFIYESAAMNSHEVTRLVGLCWNLIKADLSRRN